MHYDLAGAEHDVDHPGGAPAVRRTYLLCSNPRSGSTLLSEALHATGRLGTPIEYFDGTDAMLALVQRWGCRDLRCYVGCLRRRRTTRDGVLGVKMHWYQLQETTMALGLDPLLPGHAGQRRALAALLGEPQYVHVVRRDLDRQAVSWSVAEATGRWTDLDGTGAPPDVDYDFDAIDYCRRRLETAETAWRALFAAAGADPLEVSYEQLSDDYPGTVAAVARHLGAELEPDELPAPRLRRQSNERTERMVARYREERAARRGAAGPPSLRGDGLFGDAHLSTAALGGVPPLREGPGRDVRDPS